MPVQLSEHLFSHRLMNSAQICLKKEVAVVSEPWLVLELLCIAF